MGKIAGDPTSQAPSLMVWCRTRCCVGHPCRWVVQGWLGSSTVSHPALRPPQGVTHPQQGTCHRKPPQASSPVPLA